MKQNDTINILLLFFCILLLGFVYVNSKMVDSQPHTEEAHYESTQPTIEETSMEIIE